MKSPMSSSWPRSEEEPPRPLVDLGEGGRSRDEEQHQEQDLQYKTTKGNEELATAVVAAEAIVDDDGNVEHIQKASVVMVESSNGQELDNLAGIPQRSQADNCEACCNCLGTLVCIGITGVASFYLILLTFAASPTHGLGGGSYGFMAFCILMLIFVIFSCCQCIKGMSQPSSQSSQQGVTSF